MLSISSLLRFLPASFPSVDNTLSAERDTALTAMISFWRRKTARGWLWERLFPQFFIALGRGCGMRLLRDAGLSSGDCSCLLRCWFSSRS